MSKRTVVYATKRALEEAAAEGLRRPLEVVVEEAIAAGQVFHRLPSGERLVDVDGRLVVRVRTQDRTPAGTRRLLVTRIEPAQASHDERRRSR